MVRESQLPTRMTEHTPVANRIKAMCCGYENRREPVPEICTDCDEARCAVCHPENVSRRP